MRRLLMILLPLALVVAGGCAPRFDADTKAQRFFDKGRSYILAALEDQKASPEQLERARSVLARYEQTVPADIARLFRRQQEMILAVTSGKKTAALLELDAALHAAHLEAVRSIGRMHEELEATVGAPLWAAATAQLEAKMSRYFKD